MQREQNLDQFSNNFYVDLSDSLYQIMIHEQQKVHIDQRGYIWKDVLRINAAFFFFSVKLLHIFEPFSGHWYVVHVQLNRGVDAYSGKV